MQNLALDQDVLQASSSSQDEVTPFMDVVIASMDRQNAAAAKLKERERGSLSRGSYGKQNGSEDAESDDDSDDEESDQEEGKGGKFSSIALDLRIWGAGCSFFLLQPSTASLWVGPCACRLFKHHSR